MGGTVYFRAGAEGIINVGKAYTRIFHGPTWGIRAASKKLAGLAQKGEVGPGEIQDVLAQHPKLALRLDARGVDILSLDKGTSGKDLKHLFRAALYKTAIMGSFFSKGFDASRERSADFPLTFDDIHSQIRFESGKQFDEVYDLLGHEVSSLDRFLETYKGTYVVTMLICAGLAAVFSPFLPGVCDNIIDNEIGRKIANGAFWGIGGGGCVGAGLGQGWEKLHLNRKRRTLAGMAWRALNAFSKAGLEPVELQKGQRYADLLSTGVRTKYLASLGYEKIKNLSLDSDTEKRALLLCEKVPIEELKELARDDEVGVKAFKRIKDVLPINELKELLLASRQPEIRTQAFDKLAGSLTEEEIDEMAPRLINVVQLLFHPRASHAAKLVSVKASVFLEQCEELFRAFSSQMTKDDIRKIYALLSGDKDILAAKQNLKEFIGLVVDHSFTSVDVLFEIAQGEDHGDKAMDRIARQSKLDQIDLKGLRGAHSGRVRTLAYFYDPDSTAEELAEALYKHIPTSKKVEDPSETDDDHYEYSASDMVIASQFMRLRSRKEWKEIIKALVDGSKEEPESIYNQRADFAKKLGVGFGIQV
ncbi:MAG: hypothetical protein V3T21_00080 [Candidatus Margulisiibacteriota bacterium]